MLKSKIPRQVWIPLIILVLVFVLPMFMFRLEEGKQAIITVLGKPRPHALVEAGLQFNLPWWKVMMFEKRILRWDGDASNQLNTAEQTFIRLDTTARWRIVDPLQFYKSVKNIDKARLRLDDIIDSVVRAQVSQNKLIELVRNSNRQPAKPENRLSEDGNESSDETKWGTIEKGRLAILQQIIKDSIPNLGNDMGIELIDVQVKRLKYIQSVEKTIFDRMIAERNRIAQRYRSEGEGEAANIVGTMERKLKEIQSEAYRKAQEVEGEADAEATRIYAEAFNLDPEFYAFVQTLESYRKTMGKHTSLITSTTGDYYHYFKKIK